MWARADSSMPAAGRRSSCVLPQKGVSSVLRAGPFRAMGMGKNLTRY